MCHPWPEQVETRDYAQITSSLSERGWCVIPDFIPPEFVSALQQEAWKLRDNGYFRQAGVGQSDRFALCDQIRTDRVMWLEPGKTAGIMGHYLDVIDEMRLAINRELLLGLFEFEGHAAIYPPGTYYRKHLDQFQNDDLRTVTVILYLNDNWRYEDGGQLRIYTGEKDDEYEEILPHAGQLVTFLSSQYVHEVMPACRERISITGWYKRRVCQANGLT